MPMCLWTNVKLRLPKASPRQRTLSTLPQADWPDGSTNLTDVIVARVVPGGNSNGLPLFSDTNLLAKSSWHR